MTYISGRRGSTGISLELNESDLLEALARASLNRVRTQWNRESSRGSKPARIIPGTNTLALLFDPSTRDAVCPGIYFLVRNDEVIYIGQSTSVRTRCIHHVSNGRKYDYALWHPCDEGDLNYYEDFWTVELNPKECSHKSMVTAVKHMAAVSEYGENYDIDL